LEAYGQILLIAMPAFLLLVLFEKWYGWRKGNDTVRNLDMVSSLSSGVTNVTKEVIGLSIGIISYEWMVEHWAFFHIENTALVYIVAIISIDFAGYWGHRLSHKVNFFWNLHIIHHSSEEFNLACALRQSIANIVSFFTIFLLPSALLGIPIGVIAVVGPLHLFAQFWYHTRHINKMGFLEKIIVTPSHHRVHHAFNPEYLDKNLGQIFIVWDKMFGTFQEELPDKPPVYGITRPVKTWNPIRINFQHLWLLIKDAWRTNNFKDKLRIWFMPTGWRPADVMDKYPVEKIKDEYHFEKYDTPASFVLQLWTWVQITVVLLMISYLFGFIAQINNLNNAYIYIYGGFVFLAVYAYTDLMDGNRSSVVFETVKNICGITVILYWGDWFGTDTLLHPLVKHLMTAYFVIATVVTGWLVYRQYKTEKSPPAIAMGS
jgi:alkylglycerol monooxygenase